MGRTLRRALAASGTLCVIDDSNVVIHMDRIEFTLLCAERTSDTACLADLLDSRSFVVGAALYEVVCLVRNKLDQVTRTSLRTLTTGNTLLLVDNGNTVYNMDRVKLTCLYTGTKTGTAVAAGLRTAGRHYRCLCTVINTFVVVKSLNLVTGTFTTYKCNLLLCCSGRYAKDSSDLFAYRCSTYRTCICRSFSFCNCLC